MSSDRKAFHENELTFLKMIFKLFKVAFTEHPVFPHRRKNTHMRIKNTHTRVKFLLMLACFILLFTKHACFSMPISMVFQYAYFYAKQKNKIRTQYAYFSGIYKDFFPM